MEVCLQLLRAGADVRSVDSGGATALPYASRCHLAKVSALLDHGAAAVVNARDRRGWTALALAALALPQV